LHKWHIHNICIYLYIQYNRCCLHKTNSHMRVRLHVRLRVRALQARTV
jgi:hypothetical protein